MPSVRLLHAVGLLTALALCSIDAQLSLPALRRQPVHGVPLICGRKIEQFVLLQNVDFTPTDHFSTDPLHGFLKGLLLPVSEDAQGVFYHASNGVVVGRPYPPFEHHPETGGVYISKTKPGIAYGYLGDARKPEAQLSMMSERLRKGVLEKFLVGHAVPPGKKAKVQYRRSNRQPSRLRSNSETHLVQQLQFDDNGLPNCNPPRGQALTTRDQPETELVLRYARIS